jgi:plastocyanin
MVQEGSAYRFSPATVTIKRGDQVKFVLTSGGPHNVAFDAEKIPDAAERALAAGMPGQISPLAGTILTKAGESYTVSFAGVAPGSYAFYCMPHMSMGMRGTVIVQ